MGSLSYSQKKIIKIALFYFVLVLGMAVYFGYIRPHFHRSIKISGIFIDHPKEIPDFQLWDSQGKTFTKENLKGHWTLMYFGFTHCATVCPTTLLVLDKTYQILQSHLPVDQLPQVIFVSIDPERDSLIRIRRYVYSFNSHFLGATANANELNRLVTALSINVSNV